MRIRSYVGLRKKLNHVLKIDGDELFKDLLTNKIFLGKFYLGILNEILLE